MNLIIEIPLSLCVFSCLYVACVLCGLILVSMIAIYVRVTVFCGIFFCNLIFSAFRRWYKKKWIAVIAVIGSFFSHLSCVVVFVVVLLCGKMWSHVRVPLVSYCRHYFCVFLLKIYIVDLTL